MKFKAIEIIPLMKYGFFIETKEKPDRVLKERIRSQIETAMDFLEREFPTLPAIRITSYLHFYRAEVRRMYCPPGNSRR